LGNYYYRDGSPSTLAAILESLGVKEVVLAGEFHAKLKPVDRVAQARVELRLGYVTSKEFADGIYYPTRWETRVFEMKKIGDEFVANIEISTTWIGNFLSVIYGIIKSPAQHLAQKMFQKMFVPKFLIRITGDEPLYLSAQITKLTVVDVNGELFDFKIEEEVSTMLQKLCKVFNDECYLYALALSPIALSIASPDGNRLGCYGGKLYKEIDGSFYSGLDAPIQIILIANPKDGAYTINVEGLEDGSYSLYAGIIRGGVLTIDFERENVEVVSGTREAFELSTTKNVTYTPQDSTFFISSLIILTLILSTAALLVWRTLLSSQRKKKLNQLKKLEAMYKQGEISYEVYSKLRLELEKEKS
jgi:hypothetical protein